MNHVVRRGDTLYRIARLLQVTSATCWPGTASAAAQPSLHPGQVLVASVSRGSCRRDTGYSLGQARADRRSRHRPLDRLGHRPGHAPQGAELALSYANDKFKERVRAAGATAGRAPHPAAGRVTATSRSTRPSSTCGQEWGTLDILVHAVAFAPREALAGSFTRQHLARGLPRGPRISSYSFTALAAARCR